MKVTSVLLVGFEEYRVTSVSRLTGEQKAPTKYDDNFLEDDSCQGEIVRKSAPCYYHTVKLFLVVEEKRPRSDEMVKT